MSIKFVLLSWREPFARDILEANSYRPNIQSETFGRSLADQTDVELTCHRQPTSLNL